MTDEEIEALAAKLIAEVGSAPAARCEAEAFELSHFPDSEPIPTSHWKCS